MGSYRFSSPYDMFKQCVDVTKKLLEQKRMMILFGCTQSVNFSLYITKEKFEEEYPELDFEKFKRILFDEIAVIIEQNIVMPEFEEPSLKDYLKNAEIEDTVVSDMLKEKKDKREYVFETLYIEDAVSRYNFKNSTLSNKLSDINFEINKFIFPNHDEMAYASIEFISVDKLNTRAVPSFLEGKRNYEKSKFVCDKYDIDYIIKQLQKIKEKL